MSYLTELVVGNLVGVDALGIVGQRGVAPLASVQVAFELLGDLVDQAPLRDLAGADLLVPVDLEADQRGELALDLDGEVASHHLLKPLHRDR